MACTAALRGGVTRSWTVLLSSGYFVKSPSEMDWGKHLCIPGNCCVGKKHRCGLQPGNYLDSRPLDAEDLHVVILMDSWQWAQIVDQLMPCTNILLACCKRSIQKTLRPSTLFAGHCCAVTLTESGSQRIRFRSTAG